MRVDNLDSFDKMVAETKTLKLTDDTLKVTELPDDFEPSQTEADSIAESVP